MIGTGGKVIREIVEKTGAKVNIEDDGTVKVASNDGEAMKAAIKWIKSIASDPEIGQIYEGTVVKVMEFGAFVNFFGAKDGLVHISQLASERVQKTSDVVKEGDKVKVKLLGFDDRGKVRLSMKVGRPGEKPARKSPRIARTPTSARISGSSPTSDLFQGRGAIMPAPFHNMGKEKKQKKNTFHDPRRCPRPFFIPLRHDVCRHHRPRTNVLFFSARSWAMTGSRRVRWHP